MKSEEVFENQKEEPNHIKNVVKKVFDNFWKRSDEPGENISDIKYQLIEQSETDPKALERLEKNKDSKYRTNALFAPLGAVELFFNSDESKNIPETIKEKINQKIEKVKRDIEKVKDKKLTKNEVSQVEEIVREVENYLK